MSAMLCMVLMLKACSSVHRLTESDFRFDVMISRWRPWRHFTQKSAATFWVTRSVPMQQPPPVPDL